MGNLIDNINDCIMKCKLYYKDLTRKSLCKNKKDFMDLMLKYGFETKEVHEIYDKLKRDTDIEYTINIVVNYENHIDEEASKNA